MGRGYIKCLNRLVDDSLGLEEPCPGREQDQPAGKAAKDTLPSTTWKISRSDTAEILGITGGYLSRCSRNKCGFIDYPQSGSIERACSSGAYEIAYKSGIQDEKYFSKVFKKVMGIVAEGV